MSQNIYIVYVYMLVSYLGLALARRRGVATRLACMHVIGCDNNRPFPAKPKLLPVGSKVSVI